MISEAGRSALPSVGLLGPHSVDLLNYENICDNEYLVRILSSDSSKDESVSGSSSDKGTGQTESNSATSNNTSTVVSSAPDAALHKLEVYVRRLFLSSSEKYGDEQDSRYQTGVKKISVHRGDANWITSGSTPEEIVVYGDELGLGKQAINDRFSSEIFSLVKTQDAFSSLIYRQVVVVEHIVKSIANKCFKPRAFPLLKFESEKNANTSGNGKIEARFLEDAVKCALRILEQQSRKSAQDVGAVEPLISLVLRVLRVSSPFTDNSESGLYIKKDKSSDKVPHVAQIAENLIVGQPNMSCVHFDFMRAILCNAFLDLAAYSPSLVDSRYSHAERAEKLKLCLCGAYGLLSIGACSNNIGDFLVAFADLASLSVVMEEWKKEVTTLIHEEGEEALNAPSDSASRKGPGVSVAGGAADRPLSGQKKDLIEKSMSKQKPVHNPTADPLSQSLTVKGGERPEGGSGKGLKVNTGVGASEDPDAPAADTPSNASLYEKDARVSPVSFNMQKERYFPVPVKEAVGVKDTPATSAKNSRGAAKVVLDKDFKMRVRRVVDTQTHVPGRGMGSMTVLNVTASAEYDAYVRSLHDMQTKSLSKTLRRLGRVPSSVLQIIREASVNMNSCLEALQAKEKEKRKPIWDEKSADISNVAKSGSPVLKDEDSLAEPKHYVWAAGQNSYGELGLGDTSQRRRFTELPSQLYLHNQIVSLGAGNEHSVFVTKRGNLFVVGYNENGQCGLGNTQQARGPHALYALEKEEVAQVHVYNGCEHTLAITKEGKVYSFGYNYRGQLGLGTTTSEVSPQLVRSLSSRRVLCAASSYHHSLFLCDDGSLFSVGRNDCGQLGQGDCIDKKLPKQVTLPSGENVVTMSCGQFHSVIGCSSGSAFSCGKNDYGQLGLDASETTKVPTRLPPFPEGALVQQVCCGYYHTLVLLIDGTLVGFGRNDYGQLGLGYTQPRVNGYHVVSALNDKNISSVSAGCYHSIAVASNGMLYVFGRNNHGQLGTGDLGERHHPFPVDSFLGKRIIQVAAGFYHTLVLAANVGYSRTLAGDKEHWCASDTHLAAATNLSRLDRCIDTRVEPTVEVSKLAFDDYFYGCMQSRLQKCRGTSALNQQRGSLDIDTNAITAALKELATPAVHFSVSANTSRTKLSLLNLLPFLVSMLRTSLDRMKNAKGSSTGHCTVPVTKWDEYRELSWVARQLRALSCLLSFSRQALSPPSIHTDTPFVSTDALRLLDALFDAAMLIMKDYSSAIMWSAATCSKASLSEGQSEHMSAINNLASPAVPPSRSNSMEIGLESLGAGYVDMPRPLKAMENFALIHERSAAFFASNEANEAVAKVTKDGKEMQQGEANVDAQAETALKTELASLMTESVSLLRQELLSTYYAASEGVSGPTEKALQCLSTHFGVLFSSVAACRSLLSSVELHISSPPGIKQLRSAILNFFEDQGGNAQAAAESEVNLCDFSKHLLLFGTICSKYCELSSVIDLFQASRLEGMRIFEKILGIYSALVSVCGEARASTHMTERSSECEIYQECLKAVRAAESCLSNFVKCTASVVFHEAYDAQEERTSSLSVADQQELTLGLSLVNDILLAAASSAQDNVTGSGSKVLPGAGSNLASSTSTCPPPGVLLPILAPFILASAISCPNGAPVQKILPSVRKLISSLSEYGCVELERAAPSSSVGSGNAAATAGLIDSNASRLDAHLPCTWWSRLLKLGILLYTQRSCQVSSLVLPALSFLENSSSHTGGEKEKDRGARDGTEGGHGDVNIEGLGRDVLWRYVAFPEDPSFLYGESFGTLAAANSPLDQTIMSLATELRQREMITNHAYRLLHQQSVRSSLGLEIKGSKIKSSKDSEDSFNRSRVGLEHVKGIIERVEVLLLSVLVHLDGPGLTDFLPLSQRKQQLHHQYQPVLIGKQGNKRLCRMWASVARITKHIFSRRSQLCALSEGALSWPQILSRLADCVARCHAFFLAGRPLILYSISALPCEAYHLRADIQQQKDDKKASARAAFKRCVNCIICLVRWRAVTRARGSFLSGAVTKFVTRILDLSAEAIAAPSTFMAKRSRSLKPSEDAQDLVWARVIQALATGTKQTDCFAEGLMQVNSLLNESRLSAIRVDLMIYTCIALRSIDPMLLDSNLPYDAAPGLSVSFSAFNRKRDALRRLERFIISIILNLHSSYCVQRNQDSNASASELSAISTAEAGELMVAAKLLHFLCTTTRTSARVLPQALRPEILSDLLLSLEGSRTDAAPSASSKVSSPADADGKDGTGSSSSASHSHGSASATAPAAPNGGGSASAAAVTAKRSGNNKERARVVRRTCHALVSLIQDLGATHNPTIHNDSQTMGNALLECHSTLVYHLQKSRLVVNRHDSDPLMSKGTAENAGTGGRGGSKDSLNNKRRCQELIRNPTEFCRNQEGLVVQGDKLLNNYKGMDFTLAMWVMPTMRSSSRYCFISGKISHNDAWPLISMRNDGKIVIIYGHGNEFERATSQATIPVGSWTHLSVVVEPKKIKLFVNGAVDTQVGTKGNGRAILYPVVVGTCPAGLRSRVDHIREGFDGMLAQYKYYTRALSPIHVRVIYDQGPPEGFDVKQRWVLKLLASCRLLLRSCGGLARPEILAHLAASLHLVYISDDGHRLRGAALVVLKDVLLLYTAADFTIYSAPAGKDRLEEVVDKAKDGGRRDSHGSLTALSLSSVVPTCSTGFKERMMHYLLRSIGACWLPAALVSMVAEDNLSRSGSTMLPKDGTEKKAVDVQLSKGEKDCEVTGACTTGASANADAADSKECEGKAESGQRTSVYNSDSDNGPSSISSPRDQGHKQTQDFDQSFERFLLHAPAFIVNRSEDTALTSTASPESDFLSSSSDRAKGRLDQSLEVSDLCSRIIRDLACIPSWRLALDGTIRNIRTAYVGFTDSEHPMADYDAPVSVSNDLLGLSVFLGQPYLGISSGAEVRHYFSNSVCRVLSVTKTSGSVVLLTWNPSTRMHQLVQTHNTHVYTIRPPHLPIEMRLSVIPLIVDILRCMRTCLEPLLSDHLSVRNFKHNYLRSVFLPKLCPLDALCFSLLVKCLTSDHFCANEVLEISVQPADEAKEQKYEVGTLIEALSEAATHLQNTLADSSDRPLIEEGKGKRDMWNTERSLMTRWDSISTQIVLQETLHPGETAADPTPATPPALSEEEQAYDYIFRCLQISSETFNRSGMEPNIGADACAPSQLSSSEAMIYGGKFSSLIQRFALASSRGQQKGVKSAVKDTRLDDGNQEKSVNWLGELLFRTDTITGEGEHRPDAGAKGTTSKANDHDSKSQCRGLGVCTSKNLSDGEFSAALELLFDLRSVIVANCRRFQQSIVWWSQPTPTLSTLPRQDWSISLWDSLTSVPRAQDYSEYMQSISTRITDMTLARKIDFTYALASSVRYIAGPIFFTHTTDPSRGASEGTDCSNDLLDCTDMIDSLIHALSTWIAIHSRAGAEAEEEAVCTTCLRLLLPALTFVEHPVVESKLLHICRVCTDALAVKALSGFTMSRNALSLATGSNFTLLRARAQERLGSVRGEMRYMLRKDDDDLVQLAVCLEIFQHAVARHGLNKNVVDAKNLGTADGNLTTPEKAPTKSDGVVQNDKDIVAHSIPDISTSKPGACATVGSHLTGPPKIAGVTSSSVDVDLHNCILGATPPPEGFDLGALSGIKDTDNFEDGICDNIGFPQLVEVALGVVVPGEETIFQTIYSGNSYRFVESNLTPDCVYQLRCRLLSACPQHAYDTPNNKIDQSSSLEYAWSETVDFRTDHGVPFTFDTNRCGSDILIAEDGLSASYAGDDCWSTALANRSFTTGVTSWEISVTQSSTAYIFVGVASSDVELNSFLGGCASGWGFIGEQSLYHSREKVKVYGEPFGAGDVVGVTLDLVKGTLSFSRNGNPLGVAFTDLYGQFYPAIAFYNMGQELEIVRDSFRTTCPQEPIPCSPDRFNLHEVSRATEMLLCMEHRIPFSPILCALLADECNTWCSCLQKLHVSVSGKAVLLDQKGALLERFGLVVGERVRTPSGVARVSGIAYNRLWFSIENSSDGELEPRAWFYSTKQVTQGRKKGFFKRCTYEPQITADMNSTAGNVIHVVDAGTPHDNRGHPEGSAPFSPSPLSTPGVVSTPASPSPHRVIINDNTPTSHTHRSRRAGSGIWPSSGKKKSGDSGAAPLEKAAFDSATMADLANSVYWTEAMDEALVEHFQATASQRGYFSIWEVTADDLEADFRTLQTTLSRLVMEGEENVSNKWGFRGPKRRAVVARMATLRSLNLLLSHNIVVLTPSKDLHGSILSAPSKFSDKAEPKSVSLITSEMKSPSATADGFTRNGEELVYVANENGQEGGAVAQHTDSDSYNAHRQSEEPCSADMFASAPILSFSWNSSCAESPASTIKPYPQYTYSSAMSLHQHACSSGSLNWRSRVFMDLKRKFFMECLAKSATKPSKTEDDYDYPDDLPQVRINRIRSFRAREAADLHGVPGEDLVPSSMFHQLWSELRQQPLEKLRISYTHPMDDGQCRAFKIRFDGEGVDDYGGPYREIFQQVFDELQASDPSASAARSADMGRGANSSLTNRGGSFIALGNFGGDGIGGETASLDGSINLGESFDSLSVGAAGTISGEQVRHPDKCLLPLLMPSPNWTAGECTERYKYLFNISSRSDLHMDLFKFMGQMLGLAVRSKICVDIAFPSLVWKYVTRQILTEQDLASFDVHAYHFTQHLASFHKRYSTASTESERTLIMQEAQGILQDLTWSAALSDGSVVDLVEGGSTKPVVLEDLGMYLTAYTSARLQEAAPAMEAFRRGVVSVIPESAITFLPWKELQCLVCGASTIDIDRLRQNTEYDEDLSADDPHVKMFWQVLSEFSEVEKAAFLRFVWARPSLPPKGVAFPQKFKVQGCVGSEEGKANPEHMLPRAHTCFFSINLPKYPTAQMMAEKIRYAIFNCTEMDADFRLTDASVVGWTVDEPALSGPSTSEGA